MLKQTLTILLLVFCASLSMAQSQEVQVNASIDRNKILIGEPILLTLRVEIPTATRMGWFNLDTIPHFQFIAKNRIDTQNNARAVIFKQIISITSFDSGSWTIPQLGLTVGNNRYLTDSLTVMVDYSKMDPNQPYHDVKDILEVPASDSSYISYIIAAITIIAIALLVYLLWKKKKPVATPSVLSGPLLSPLEQALKDLDLLKQENLPAKALMKSYFIRLNDITRTYYRNRRLVTAPDASNEALVLKVKSDLPAEQFSGFAQSLRLADAVKFARYTPSSEEQEEAFEAIKKSLTIIDEVHYKTPGT